MATRTWRRPILLQKRNPDKLTGAVPPLPSSAIGITGASVSENIFQKGGLFFLSDELLIGGSRDDPLIAPGQLQTCSSATTDTSTAAIILSFGCASRTASSSHERGMQGTQLLRPAQGRPKGHGRPFLFQSSSTCQSSISAVSSLPKSTCSLVASRS
jgi:hypothetical protein